MTRTPMARLPWMIWTRFLSPYEILLLAQKIFREILLFYHEIVCCVYALELSHRCDSNEYTQYTIIV